MGIHLMPPLYKMVITPGVPPAPSLFCEPYGRLYWLGNPYTGSAYSYKFTPALALTIIQTTWEMGKVDAGVTPSYIEYRLYLSDDAGEPLGSPLRSVQLPCPPPDWPVTHIMEFNYDPILLTGEQPYAHCFYVSPLPYTGRSTYLNIREAEFYTCCPCFSQWVKWSIDYEWAFFSTMQSAAKIYGY